MKKILFGLGCGFLLPGTIVAQDQAPAARLGVPGTVIRAQSPDPRPAAAFDTPKIMPKGTVSDLPPAPTPLPLPSSPAAPAGPMPPGAPTPGPTLVPPGGIYSSPIPTGPIVMDPGAYGAPGCPTGGCPTQSNWYANFEALMWFVNGYKVPPLLTAGPTGTSGIIGNPNVVTIYGNETIDTNPRYGGRLTLGYWFSPCWAVELSGFYTTSRETSFTTGTADVLDADLARPFFSTNQLAETAEIVSRNGVASGSVTILNRSWLYGAELNARRRWWSDPVNGLDLLAGVRFLSLQEELKISESSLGLAGAGAMAGVSRTLEDTFETRNNFLGVQIGAIYTYTSGPWSVEVRGKVAAGIDRRYTKISGGITDQVGGNPPNRPGALLALSSNIGEHRKDSFSVVPELGLNLGYDITSRLRVYGGYSLLYWTNVSRPGDQIDRSIDENLIPDWPARPPANGLRPLPRNETANVWIQGFNLGLMYKW